MTPDIPDIREGCVIHFPPGGWFVEHLCPRCPECGEGPKAYPIRSWRYVRYRLNRLLERMTQKNVSNP